MVRLLWLKGSNSKLGLPVFATEVSHAACSVEVVHASVFQQHAEDR